MRQFVAQQTWLGTVPTQHDMFADGIGTRAYGRGRVCSEAVRVEPYGREIVPEPFLEECRAGRVERSAV
jgi:hypothetical protein